MLLLLEGELVKLAALKILFGKYVYIKSDIPIFATSKCIINFHGLYNTANDMEDKVMKVKQIVFFFSPIFLKENQKKVLA